MTIHWISFTAPMVSAILSGEKTETRRSRKPRWAAGDVLKVLEPIRASADGHDTCYAADDMRARVDGRFVPWRWKASGLPGRYMPRELSRIDLEVLEVREERLQEITDDAVAAEGVTLAAARELLFSKMSTRKAADLIARAPTPRDLFALGWDAINGGKPGASWADNPIVHVTKFRKVKP